MQIKKKNLSKFGTIRLNNIESFKITKKKEEKCHHHHLLINLDLSVWKSYKNWIDFKCECEKNKEENIH